MEKSNGGLWEKKTKKGDKYMTGTIDGKKVIVFKNTYKDPEDPNDNKPHWKVYPKSDMSKQPESPTTTETDVSF